MRTPRVVVVGAGIGGLVSALVLAHRGLDVTLIESAHQPGGKIRQVQVDGVGVFAVYSFLFFLAFSRLNVMRFLVVFDWSTYYQLFVKLLIMLKVLR
jgi:phytoene dehydrogenase-like protein